MYLIKVELNTPLRSPWGLISLCKHCPEAQNCQDVTKWKFVMFGVAFCRGNPLGTTHACCHSQRSMLWWWYQGVITTDYCLLLLDDIDTTEKDRMKRTQSESNSHCHFFAQFDSTIIVPKDLSCTTTGLGTMHVRLLASRMWIHFEHDWGLTAMKIHW